MAANQAKLQQRALRSSTQCNESTTPEAKRHRAQERILLTLKTLPPHRGSCTNKTTCHTGMTHTLLTVIQLIAKTQRRQNTGRDRLTAVVGALSPRPHTPMYQVHTRCLKKTEPGRHKNNQSIPTAILLHALIVTHFTPEFLRAAYKARTRSGGDCTEVGDRSDPSPPPPPSLRATFGSGLEKGNIGRFAPEELKSSEVTVLTTLLCVGYMCIKQYRNEFEFASFVFSVGGVGVGSCVVLSDWGGRGEGGHRIYIHIIRIYILPQIHVIPDPGVPVFACVMSCPGHQRGGVEGKEY